MKKTLLIALCLYSVLSLTAMATMNIGFFLVAVLTLVTFRKKDWRTSDGFREYFKWGGVLFLACLTSLICAHFFPFAYAGHKPDITAHGFLKIWYLAVPATLLAAFLSSPSREKTLSTMISCWWLGTIVLSVVAVIQYFTGWPFPQQLPNIPGRYHATLFFGHHLSTSSVIIFPTFTAIAVGLGMWARTKKVDRLAALTGVAGLLILFLSYARTAWLAIPLGLVLTWLKFLRPRTVLISSAILLALILIGSQTSMMKDRIHNHVGVSERFHLWEANIDFFKHRPLTGIGWLKTAEMSEFYFREKDPVNYFRYQWGHAHSNIFEMLGGTGLIGLIAFILWSLFTLKLAANVRGEAKKRGDHRSADFAWGIFVALLLLHFNGLTNVTFWEGKVMHTQMFAVAMLLMMDAMAIKSRK